MACGSCVGGLLWRGEIWVEVLLLLALILALSLDGLLRRGSLQKRRGAT